MLWGSVACQLASDYLDLICKYESRFEVDDSRSALICPVVERLGTSLIASHPSLSRFPSLPVFMKINHERHWVSKSMETAVFHKQQGKNTGK